MACFIFLYHSAIGAQSSLGEIREVVLQYEQAARHAVDADFDGVEIHGAHGYFMAP